MPSEFKRRLKIKSNVFELKRWIKRLSTKAYLDGVKKRFEDRDEVNELWVNSQQLVKKLIYDVYPEKSYVRTYDLLNSITAVAGADTGLKKVFSSVAVYSDPDIARTKLGASPFWSYIVFFELPQEAGFNTFIKPRGIAKKYVNHRPFFSRLEALVQKGATGRARKAFMDEARESRPEVIRTIKNFKATLKK